jgi:hypothetical protein
LRAAGIDAGVGMAPILPGLSDRPELLADVVKAARDAGATSIWTNLLYLRPGTREHFLDHLARDWPELLPAYERLYRGRAYLGKAELEPVRREVAELRHRFAVSEPGTVPRPPGAIEQPRPKLQVPEATPPNRRIPVRSTSSTSASQRASPLAPREPDQLALEWPRSA